jgi:16S rRNA (guanine(966)-N(2))-methyltransferase RsmD
MDRVKEALFSIIGRRIVDSTILDLFAGTGSVGIEALSRGARHAVFVDLERAAIQTIRANLELTRLLDSATIRRTDALQLLRQSPPAPPYDYIYIAPPQYKDLWLKTLHALDANPGWIGDDTTVIVQIDPSEQQDVSLSHLEPFDMRRYGSTILWFFAAPDDESGDNTADDNEESA